MPEARALTAIAAVARNGVIGRDGGLPWHIPDDMRHFKAVTMGGALVMGRATYESFGSRPLPGRALFVVSRSLSQPEIGLNRSASTRADRLGINFGSENPLGAPISSTQSPGRPQRDSFEASSVTWCPNIGEALSAARESGRPVFVAGGEAIYEAAWPLLTDLDLTLVDAEPVGDRYFPAVVDAEWEETFREPHDGFSFVRYRRRP